MQINFKNLTIKSAHEHLLKGDFSVSELTQACIENIKKQNGELNVILEVYDDVMEQAEKADEIIKAGLGGPLTGIPLVLKDNILIEGKIASAASKILANHRATYDAFVIKKLREAGVVFIGRANMDEFAMGASTENSAYGVTKNPYDTTRVPGGSSGGSAVAVASNMSLCSLGTDTGGSVRQPSAFCGVVGLKPTYGAVSRRGAIAMGNSLDQIGPIAHTVEDVETIFNIISGYDLKDSTSHNDELREVYRNRNKKIKIKKLGVPISLLDTDGMDTEIKENFKKMIEDFKGLGYEIVNIEMPMSEYSLPVYYILMPAEVSTNLSRFDGIRYGEQKDGANLLEVYKNSRGVGFGVETRRRIILGTYVLSHGYYDAYYNKAKALRSLIEKEFDTIFKDVDAILMPTTPTPAFKIGEKIKDPVSMYLADIFTVSANIGGVPAISIPSGKTKEGLPIGFQIIAPKFCEDILFSLGKEYENLNKSR